MGPIPKPKPVVNGPISLPKPVFMEGLRTLEDITVEFFKDEVVSKKDESSEQSESTDD